MAADNPRKQNVSIVFWPKFNDSVTSTKKRFMNVGSYRVDQQKIIFETGKFIEFDFSVQDTLVFDGKIIVLLDVSGNIRFNRNVYAIDFNGELLWQIERSENLDLIGYCPFISVEAQNPKLVSFNWCGFKFIIDPDTGKVIESIFTK
ncbi:hypothetical protein SAMN05192574_109106 [Mucilaginibacter gossypiicola]|uniref:WG containing repeat-containing protein n=2 Tax=Mucilaginibacter gossypiicola TaxID=551995 RepID=A0A1H8QQK3_9SPHI|nr:hypothetical protein SAMN05192574_109106 [Mucilaginibacter gossypiicola]